MHQRIGADLKEACLSMNPSYQSPLRLKLDSAALLANYQWLNGRSGAAACGAAVKANGYGLGAVQVMQQLAEAGCRNFFVATWAEAEKLLDAGVIDDGLELSVLHGVRERDMVLAAGSGVRPVLNSEEQIARWKAAGGGPCDVMIDTGMNRLGLSLNDLDVSVLDGLEIDTLLSHLVAADEDHHLNTIQVMLFEDVRKRVKARRYSLANSAGICHGEKFLFDLVRPGVALYGGIAHPECEGNIQAVVTPQAEILQRRTVRGGESVGYGATYVANRTMETATINLGYADGYGRVFSDSGTAISGDARLPVIGRVSMDLVVIDVTELPDLKEGDWVDIDYDLSFTSMMTGLSQYELLTGLGSRFDRIWG